MKFNKNYLGHDFDLSINDYDTNNIIRSGYNFICLKCNYVFYMHSIGYRQYIKATLDARGYWIEALSCDENIIKNLIE